MMFKHLIEMGLEPKEAMHLEKAVDRFSTAKETEKKPRKVKKTFFRRVLDWIQQDEESEEDFNPVLFAIEAISFVMILAIFFLAIYFYLPEWMVI